jgi:hypothetical protein
VLLRTTANSGSLQGEVFMNAGMEVEGEHALHSGWVEHWRFRLLLPQLPMSVTALMLQGVWHSKKLPVM